MTPPPINYLDANIILSYQIGPADRFYPTARKIFEEEIAGGKVIGLVSMLTLMELIDVIRRRITERTNKQVLDAMDNNTRNIFLKTETDKRIKIMINALTSMESRGLVIFADFTPIDLGQVMENVYEYSKSYFGYIRKFYNCSICRNSFENYSYKGLGWIDLMHAYLALELCADGLVTADRSFSHLSSDNNFSALNIEIIRI